MKIYRYKKATKSMPNQATIKAVEKLIKLGFDVPTKLMEIYKKLKPCQYCKKENRTCKEGYMYHYNSCFSEAAPYCEMCEIEYIENEASTTSKNYTHFWKEGDCVEENYMGPMMPPKKELFNELKYYFYKKGYKYDERNFMFGYQKAECDD